MRKKRVCIFSYYDSDGKVGNDTIELIKQIKKNVDYVIFVSNGNVDCTMLVDITNYILIRENAGMDAGAYKMAMLKYDYLISKCNELIFCNSTFFGIFVPLEVIFEDMYRKKCDFYGLVPWRTDGDDYIQSYFLIFNEVVFKSSEFKRYFEKYINEKTNSYVEVCCYFERELQYYLKKRGFKSDTYVSENMPSPYEYPYELLSKGVPIMKKKCFDKNYNYCSREELLNCLLYIHLYLNYNIEFIISWINEKWKWGITKEEVINHKVKKYKYAPNIISSDRNDLELFYNCNKKIYIYGAGKRALRLLETLQFNNMTSKIRGIFVSDKVDIYKKIEGFPIYQYDENMIEEGSGIIVALNTYNSEEVSKKIKYDNVLYLTKFGSEKN